MAGPDLYLKTKECMSLVLGEEAGLGSGCGCSRFAAGYADYAEDGEFG